MGGFKYKNLHVYIVYYVLAYAFSLVTSDMYIRYSTSLEKLTQYSDTIFFSLNNCTLRYKKIPVKKCKDTNLIIILYYKLILSHFGRCLETRKALGRHWV